MDLEGLGVPIEKRETKYNASGLPSLRLQHYGEVLSCGTVYCAVQGGSNQGGSKSVDKTLVCDHSYESY